MNEENALYLRSLSQVAAGSSSVIASEQGAVVVQVLDRKKMVTKYQVAVVKRTLDFSKKTYEDELSRINRFLAQNQTVEAVEKNAAKAGYMIYDLPGYTPMQNVIPMRIGGAQAKDCARWIFEEAEENQISKLYECGRANDHLLVVLVKATNDKKYLSWDNPRVKEFLTIVVKQQKKAEKALALAKNVKSIADMQKLKGAVNATLTDISFAAYPSVAGVNVSEPVLAATLAKTAVGKSSAVVKGAGALYVVKTTAKKNTPEKFDQATEMQQVASIIGQRSYQSVFEYLMNHESGIKDHRYQF